MAIHEQFLTYETRLSSFRGPQPVTKRRASNASSRAPKALTWPHRNLSPASFAKAGFFFQPSPANPDNVVCFLCNKHLDGWEEEDDPLTEHLKHVPDCGWAIVAAIEAELGDYSKVHPLDPRMIEARKATFAGKWPYESKRGFKCKTKQLVEAGWYYAPTLDSDDMAACAYCQLMLEGWESGDKPIDEHYKRSPDCAYFQWVRDNPAPKKPSGRGKAVRASKASRLSIQSVATTASEMQLAADITADHDDSVMTTASSMTQGGKKAPRGRKPAAAKTRKPRAKKDDAVEILEDDHDAQMPHPLPPKPARGRKRGSDAVEDSVLTNLEAPAPKKRATRGVVNDVAMDDPVPNATRQDMDMPDAAEPMAKQPVGRKKGRASTAKTTRKASAASLRSKASTASLRAQAAVDAELDRQLQADLERPLTDDEYITADSDTERKNASGTSTKGNTKKPAISRKAIAQHTQEPANDYAMFDPVPVQPDEAQVEDELKALEAEMKAEAHSQPLEVPKKGRKPGPRKASKQTKKAKEPEAPPPTPPAPVEEPSENSIVVPEAGFQPMTAEDSSSGTVVNKTSGSQATAAKPGRGRPKKNSAASQPATKQPEEEPVIAPAAPSLPERIEVEVEVESVTLQESFAASNRSPGKATSYTPASSHPGQGQLRTNKALPLAPPPPPPHSDKPAVAIAPPTTPRANRTPASASASAKQATLSPSQSPQSSDAENQPPSSKPASSAAAKRVALAPISLPATTPLRNNMGSPSRRNVVAGLRSIQPWKAVDLDLVFELAGEGETEDKVAARLLKKGGAELSTPERNMTVEEWIFHNAGLAEQMLKSECENMVSRFEVEGGRAMRVLEGIVVE